MEAFPGTFCCNNRCIGGATGAWCLRYGKWWSAYGWNYNSNGIKTSSWNYGWPASKLSSSARIIFVYTRSKTGKCIRWIKCYPGSADSRNTGMVRCVWSYAGDWDCAITGIAGRSCNSSRAVETGALMIVTTIVWVLPLASFAVT